MFGSSLRLLFVGGFMSYLGRYLCFSSCNVVSTTYCVVFLCVFLRLAYLMLPVSLNCLSSSCVPPVASFSGFFICDCLFGIL